MFMTPTKGRGKLGEGEDENVESYCRVKGLLCLDEFISSIGVIMNPNS